MSGKKSKIRSFKNPLEAVTNISDATGIARGVGDSLMNDLVLDGGNDFLDFLGLGKSSSDKQSHTEAKAQDSDHSGSIDIVNFQKSAAKTESRIEAAIDYHREIVKAGEHTTKRETSTMNSQVEQILSELRSLISSTKILEMEFTQISMETPTQNVGTYHANFFEWMLIVIKSAREKVEDSGAWMSAAKGKAGKKGYWGMFKKHGTSFALSNERGVATQVG